MPELLFMICMEVLFAGQPGVPVAAASVCPFSVPAHLVRPLTGDGRDCTLEADTRALIAGPTRTAKDADTTGTRPTG